MLWKSSLVTGAEAELIAIPLDCGPRPRIPRALLALRILRGAGFKIQDLGPDF